MDNATPSNNSIFALWSTKTYEISLFKSDTSFKELHSTMDSVYRKLHSDGVGAEQHNPSQKMKRTNFGNMEYWTRTLPQHYCEQYSSTMEKNFVLEVVTNTEI